MKHLLFILFLLPCLLLAQGEKKTENYQEYIPSPDTLVEKDVGLVIGYNRNFRTGSLPEIGIAYKVFTPGHHPKTWVYAFSNEVSWLNDWVWGPKLSVWVSGGNAGLNLGLNLGSYIELDNWSQLTYIRPEVGMGFDFFRFYYGYNVLLYERDQSEVNSHHIGVSFVLDLVHRS